jgi:hypothetical protein
VLGVLIEIFRRNAVAADRGFSREGDVPLEYLMGAPADLGVGAVAVDGLISLERSLGLLVWPVAVIGADADLSLISFFPMGVGWCACPERQVASVTICLFGLRSNNVRGKRKLAGRCVARVRRGATPLQRKPGAKYRGQLARLASGTSRGRVEVDP